MSTGGFNYADDLELAMNTQKKMGMVGCLLDFSYVEEIIEQLRVLEIEVQAIEGSYERCVDEKKALMRLFKEFKEEDKNVDTYKQWE